MKTFTHLLCVLILSIVLFACNNAHFLKEEAYRNQVAQDFELKKQALPHGDLFAIFADSVLSVYEREEIKDRNGNVIKTVAKVNPGLCQGCGTCVAFCRSKSIDIQGYSNEQVYAEVMALLNH